MVCFTDGSCYYKTGQGGIGIYIPDLNIIHSRGLKNTTTGRAELTGMLTCLRLVKDKDIKLEIYCDSQYVVNVVNEWITVWKTFHFSEKKNKDLLNQLWYELKRFRYKPKAIHIKGHQKQISDEFVRGNMIVDLLANYKNFIKTEDETNNREK